MQAVVTAARAAQAHNLHRAGGRFGVAFVLARLRALDTAGVLGRTSSLFRAALVAMSLQELAHQLLAPPVQFPFEFALAHLPVFGVNYSGRSTTIILAGPASRIQDDDACARTAAGEIDAGRGCCDDAGVRLGKVAGIEEGALDADEQRIEPLGPGTRLAKYASEYGNVATR